MAVQTRSQEKEYDSRYFFYCLFHITSSEDGTCHSTMGRGDCDLVGIAWRRQIGIKNSNFNSVYFFPDERASTTPGPGANLARGGAGLGRFSRDVLAPWISGLSSPRAAACSDPAGQLVPL